MLHACSFHRTTLAMASWQVAGGAGPGASPRRPLSCSRSGTSQRKVGQAHSNAIGSGAKVPLVSAFIIKLTFILMITHHPLPAACCLEGSWRSNNPLCLRKAWASAAQHHRRQDTRASGRYGLWRVFKGSTAKAGQRGITRPSPINCPSPLAGR